MTIPMSRLTYQYHAQSLGSHRVVHRENIKLDWKFTKVCKVRKGTRHYAKLYECLMTLEYSRALPPRRTAPGFPHYLFRDKTSLHVTSRALGRVQLSRSINFTPQSDIRPNGRLRLAVCRFCDGDQRCSSRYTKIRCKSVHQSPLRRREISLKHPTWECFYIIISLRAVISMLEK